MDKNKYIGSQWRRRKKRVRGKVSGDAECPRLSVFRSARHIYAELIDDESGSTLISASTLADKFSEVSYCGNRVAASKIGEAVARKALAVGIHKVRFDRNGYKFHGRVQALAEAARKAGLVF